MHQTSSNHVNRKKTPRKQIFHQPYITKISIPIKHNLNTNNGIGGDYKKQIAFPIS